MAETAKTLILGLIDCLISRRGKGAKGHVAVKTFGIPVTVEVEADGKKIQVAKDWDYTPFLSNPWSAVVDTCKTQAPQINRVHALLLGYDELLKSENLQNSSQAAILADSFLAEKEALDLADLSAAKDMAKLYLKEIAWVLENRGEELTMEELLDKRRKFVAKKKLTPTLNTSQKVN